MFDELKELACLMNLKKEVKNRQISESCNVKYSKEI